MKHVLILGAGQSTPYLISYMLENAEKYDWFVTLGDLDYSLASKRINNHPRGTAIKFDINDADIRREFIKKSDIVINLLAPTFQFLIALDCLNFKKHCISASYENVRVKDLHRDAKKAGILILNEMGLDPGIDHMMAMSIIHKIKNRGGEVRSFISYGSGIPAPEVKSNPMNYCITWNPRNVVMAGESGSLYKEKGKIKVLSRNQVFRRTWNVDIEGIGTLEAYPNRDSLVYLDIFDLQKVDTMIRGTLRYPGWSETWHQIVRMGMPNENLLIPDLCERTYAEFTEMFLPLNVSGDKLEKRVANYLNISPTGKIIENLRWMGLFSDEKIDGNATTAAKVLEKILIEKMPLPPGARDMVILQHEIEAVYPNENNRKEDIKATFIEYGEPDGFTAISKTVGAPAAIAAKLILTGNLDVSGCRIPTHPAIYNKVLKELKELGFAFTEKVDVLD